MLCFSRLNALMFSLHYSKSYIHLGVKSLAIITKFQLPVHCRRPKGQTKELRALGDRI